MPQERSTPVAEIARTAAGAYGEWTPLPTTTSSRSSSLPGTAPPREGAGWRGATVHLNAGASPPGHVTCLLTTVGGLNPRLFPPWVSPSIRVVGRGPLQRREAAISRRGSRTGKQQTPPAARPRALGGRGCGGALEASRSNRTFRQTCANASCPGKRTNHGCTAAGLQKGCSTDTQSCPPHGQTVTR